MKHSQPFPHRAFIVTVSTVMLGAWLTVGPSLGSASAATPAAARYSLWGTVGRVEEADVNPVELGVKFRADVEGHVTAVRFYRAVAIDSGYKVRIWSASGDLLGAGLAVEGQGPTPGWQQVAIYPPVPITAGQTYIASYYASKGQYSVSENYFTNSTVTNGPIRALSDGEDGGNGVFLYGEGGGFPNQTYNASNYWVDVVFTPTPLPQAGQ